MTDTGTPGITPGTPEHEAAYGEPPRDEREVRLLLARDLEGVARALDQMLGHWYEFDARPDILAPDEFPFTRALEDLTAEVWGAAGRIQQRSDPDSGLAEDQRIIRKFNDDDHAETRGDES